MTVRYVIRLPWPPKALKPNGGHGHWSAKWKAGKGYKLACMWTCKEQGIGKIRARRIKAKYTFNPPGKYRYDMDNLIARMKYAQDAVAEMIGVDDSKWEMEKPAMGDVRPDGAVIMEIESA